ncbi:MAG: efflux RND transporter periplasmic adaptor subunit, partial [Cetobacterium sp.]
MKKVMIIFIVIAGLLGCGKKKEAHPLDVEVRPVRYVVVEKKGNMLKRQFTGNIASTALSQLSFKVSGTVNAKYVDLGDRVVKGQVLAKLDPIDYEVKYQQSYAQLENTKASLSEARSNFERDRILYLDNSISKAQYQSSQAKYESTKASVEASAKNVEFNRLQLDYASLVSPVNGIIAKVEIEVNEAVTPQTPVFTIDTLGGFEVRFSVSEDIVSRLKLGEKIEVGVEALNDKIPAIITNVGSVSNNFGNTYPVKAFISNAPDRLRVGMTATVYIDLNIDAQNRPQIIVPVNSV